VLELMVVVSIAAVLAAMSAGAYDQIISRADFSSVVGNVVTSVRLTRSEAAGRGVATAFVIDTRNNRWWGVEAPTGWTLAAFDPTNPGTVIASDTFPTGSGKAVFGPVGGYGQRLPAPFASVPVGSCSESSAEATPKNVMGGPGASVQVAVGVAVISGVGVVPGVPGPDVGVGAPGQPCSASLTAAMSSSTPTPPVAFAS